MPLAATLKAQHIGVYWKVLPPVFAALYAVHPLTATKELQGIPGEIAENPGADEVINLQMRRTPPREPYEEREGRAYKVSFETLLRVIVLLDSISTDAILAGVICKICDCIRDQKKNSFTREQREDIGKQLEQVISRKMPDKNNILHQGYVVVCRAAVTMAKRDTSDKAWTPLIGEADSIPNVSDSAYCLAHLVRYLPRRFDKERRDCIDKFKAKISQIPSDLDRCERLEVIGSLLERFEPVLSKDLLTRGFEASHQLDEGETRERIQRRIIDVLYRVDEKAARLQIEREEKDPVRQTEQEMLKGRVRSLEMRKRLEEPGAEEPRPSERREFCSAAWMRLGALNAGTSSPLGTQAARQAVCIAAQIPLDESYPLMSLVVQSAVSRFTTHDDVVRIIRPLVESFTLTGHLACTVSARLMAVLLTTGERGKWSESENLIYPGMQQQVVFRIREWLRGEAGANLILVSDPYFGPDELWLVKMIKEECRAASIKVLTSRQGVGDESLALGDLFSRGWRDVAVDSEAPPCDITVCGIQDSGKSPVHDRWILSERSGLRLGSSLSGLGVSRVSEISALEPERVPKCFPDRLAMSTVDSGMRTGSY